MSESAGQWTRDLLHHMHQVGLCMRMGTGRPRVGFTCCACTVQQRVGSGRED